MTVMQKVLRNNAELLDLTGFRTTTRKTSKVLKQIAYASKVAIIVVGSMSLSLYITFLR